MAIRARQNIVGRRRLIGPPTHNNGLLADDLSPQTVQRLMPRRSAADDFSDKFAFQMRRFALVQMADNGLKLFNVLNLIHRFCRKILNRTILREFKFVIFAKKN